MARYNSDWDDLGRSIQDIVDQAVNSRDYQKLNQTIRQTVSRAVDMGSEAVRRAVDGTASYPQRTQATVEKKDLPVLYGGTGSRTTAGILKIVGGGLLSGISFVALFSAALLDLLVGGPGISMLSAGVGLTVLGGGIALLSNGISNVNRIGRFKTYRKILGDKTYCALDRLARGVGKSVKFVRRELQQMIDEGLFLEGHMDREGTQLITSHETYRYFEQSRLQLEQRRRQEAEEKAQAQAKKAASGHAPQVQEVLDRGNAFIAEIHRCNDRIPGEEISAKIDRMELIVKKIFDRAEAHPEIIPDLKKLMDYYLPMTVKLLNAYADMDAQPVQGETIANSKREIEGTLDTLNRAFEKLLDDLFADTALDISSDITVLNTLLAQEGLTEDGLHKK